jgi:hypothetical protein
VVSICSLTVGFHILERWGFPAWARFVPLGINAIVPGLLLDKLAVLVPRGHHCAGCGYNLHGLRRETCPECGLRFTVPPAQPVADDGIDPQEGKPGEA